MSAPIVYPHPCPFCLVGCKTEGNLKLHMAKCGKNPEFNKEPPAPEKPAPAPKLDRDGNPIPEPEPVGAKKVVLKCVYCKSPYTTQKTLDMHEKTCKLNPRAANEKLELAKAELAVLEKALADEDKAIADIDAKKRVPMQFISQNRAMVGASAVWHTASFTTVQVEGGPNIPRVFSYYTALGYKFVSQASVIGAGLMTLLTFQNPPEDD